jgi:GMP synthase-like glutamine amidotransferase
MVVSDRSLSRLMLGLINRADNSDDLNHRSSRAAPARRGAYHCAMDTVTRRLCILDNDNLDDAVVEQYVSYGAMTEKMFQDAGVDWQFERFNTTRGEYPADFDAFDAVLLTGSRADSFSDEPWVRTLREKVTALIAQRKPLLGICFGHQLIALCLGAEVGRAPQGWGLGRLDYAWHGDAPLVAGRDGLALLASHQDQVHTLPEGATLLASSAFCPVAAFSHGDHVFCVQPHPEFVPDYSDYLLTSRAARFGPDKSAAARATLAEPHDGLEIARFMRDFVERAAAAR